MDDLAYVDASAQAEMVRSGQASPTELVDAAIERIERVNPAINAVIHERFAKARAEAAGELPGGPFRGVPLVLKDLTATSEGDPYHAGTAFLKAAGYTAPHDAFLVRRLRSAGFVVVGRSNTPEFGSTITTEPEAHGPSRNPWNTDHSTGGSSGGSAAAVAAGLVPVAHANDGGGSIRVPASECGVVGLKPSRGRVSHGPDLGESWMGATTDGCVSRTVRDTAAVLDVLSGYETGDPYIAPPPARPFADEVGVDPGSLRIGVLDHPLAPGAAADPDCAAAVQAAGRLLENLGHKVEASWPEAFWDDAFPDHFVRIVASSMATELAYWETVVGRPLGEGDIEMTNVLYRDIGASTSAVDYLTSVTWMHAWSRRLLAWWDDEGWDVLVTPVIASPPPRIGELSGAEGAARVIELLRYTPQLNISGQPAVSLPLHWTEGGLPIGVQLVAAPHREDLLVRLASQLEAAQPWAGRIPPVHA
jgi:amidase